ncbi:MAG: hypothetical protein LHW56_02715 [Candidatus Cloacimonetes bacterium]|jgi:hypothetical protein|nr:hypothetical protein [Candidatus Cloacimonadota bacterium]MDY0171798.1 hypothetical protein [Candidatus Cloacimonadaceae bacterium]
MSIESLLSHPFELELKTKISQSMINEALALKELPTPVQKVAVEILNDMIRIHVQTSIFLMKNLSVDARILGIDLGKRKSTVHVELLGTAGGIIKKLLGLLKSKTPQISINDNILDIDITDTLLKFFPSAAAGILDDAKVHILGLTSGFLNLGIKKV